MKLINLLGSLAMVLLWLLLATSLTGPLARPFDLLLPLAAGGLFGLHLLQLLLCRRELAACARPARAVLGVLLCGAFQLPRRAREALEAPAPRVQASRPPAERHADLRSAA